MRIFVGSVQRNTTDIFPLFLANLSLQGVAKVAVVVHNEPLEEYERIAARLRGDMEISLISYESSAFYQGEMATLLARMAQRQNYDLFIPLDGDEFLDANNDLTISENLESAFATPKLKTIRVRVPAYLQSSSIIKFKSDLVSIQNCIYRTHGAVAKPRSVPVGKMIINLNQTGLFRLDEGSHSIQGIAPESIGDNLSIYLRHLPHRDRAQLETRKLDGHGRIQAGFPDGIAIHNRELIAMNETQIDGYWQSKSWSLDENGFAKVAGSPDPLVEDRALADLLMRSLTKYVEAKESRASAQQLEDERMLLALAIEDAGRLALSQNSSLANRLSRRLLRMTKR